MDSSTCGKTCLIGCVILFVLGIIVVGGCVYCGYNIFGGLFQSAIKIEGYFTELRNEGWIVDDSESNQPSGYGASVDSGQLMIYKAKETEDDDWIYYVWEIPIPDGESSDADLSALLNLTIIPRTQAALEAHEELNLELPDDFELDEWSPDADDRDRDRDRDRDEDENGDEDNGEDRRRGGKSLKRAA